jgi:hypothetical protein
LEEGGDFGLAAFPVVKGGYWRAIAEVERIREGSLVCECVIAGERGASRVSGCDNLANDLLG